MNLLNGLLGLAAIGLVGIVIDLFASKATRPPASKAEAPPALASIDGSLAKTPFAEFPGSAAK